ncbi:zinc finger and BTB domain-containing protein 38 [Corythoichthys intestinalis]|uniref:zinc finger and BTB domain-containing protein 38 n=1 Tax=Corythoichthys intestinalis TaxID=161448 RepID=UPI0025A662ED|nr:zinc finger and BTB domain-containing protein 38 [Corythoichthys intestinalis]
MDSYHPHTVLSKLNEQRLQGLFCDVTIVVEDVKFRAHKNILAACSGYFKNALTNDTWSSSRVLELMDLKSEVFACVLNFIYSSKVTLSCFEDNKELIAAGKRLGIPFLEKLAGKGKQDRNKNQLDSIKSHDWTTANVLKKSKHEATRPEEIDGTRGPRITNAFSINEVCAGNNPFTPLEDGRQSPDEVKLPERSPTSSCLDGINETTLPFLDHSYAFEGNGVNGRADGGSLPLTFMATTNMVAPIMPRISFDKPCDTDIDQSLLQNYQQRTSGKDDTHSSPFINFDSTVPLQSDPESSPISNKGNPFNLTNSHHIHQNVSFLNSLNNVEKLSELSASAKRLEKMTQEMLQSNPEELSLDKTAGATTQTYIAKPVCPGPSADGDARPLCQITVKIGDEAIVSRRIKGSKLFPRRKKKIRKMGDLESQSQLHPDDKLESPKLRFRTDISGLISEPYEDPNDCDVADELWRPYYSYKAKKKKKLKFKHRKTLYQEHKVSARTDTVDSEARLDSWQTGDGTSGGEDLKRSLQPRTIYNCDICDSSFITETGLRAHIIGSHPYFCRTCGKQGPPGETPSGNDYVCNSCMENGSCFDNSNWSPKPEKKFRCSFCPQRFLYLATKRSHEKKHLETPGESYTNKPCLEFLDNVSEKNKKDCIKTEDDDYQESSDMQCEDGAHFPMKKVKTEETSELITWTPNQDITYAHLSSSFPQPEPLCTLTSPSKMKQKMKKHSLGQALNQQVQRRDANKDKDSLEVESVNDNDKSCKLPRKTALGFKDNQISGHRPEKRMSKNKTFF